MASRRKIPDVTQAQVLLEGRRRCCVCFGLKRDDGLKRGQIAHLDRDRTNNRPSNLAFLCLDHHDEYDSPTSQSKGLTKAEIRHFRDELKDYLGRAYKLAHEEELRPPDPPTMEGLLDFFESREDFVAMFGRAPRPVGDGVSSHGNWALRFHTPYEAAVGNGIFTDSGSYFYRVGKTHYIFNCLNNELKSFDIEDERLDTPSTALAAKDLLSLYRRENGSIVVYEIDEETHEAREAFRLLGGHHCSPVHGSFDVNSERLLTCDKEGGITIWDFPNRKILFQMNTCVESVTESSFSHMDDRIIITGKDGSFEVFDARTARSIVRSKLSIKGAYAHVSLSMDGSYFVGSDEADRWDVSDSKTLQSIERWKWHQIFTSNHPSTDGRVQLIKSASGLIWAMQSVPHSPEGKRLELLPPVDRRCTWMALSNDGRFAATVTERRDVRIWENLLPA